MTTNLKKRISKLEETQYIPGHNQQGVDHFLYCLNKIYGDSQPYESMTPQEFDQWIEESLRKFYGSDPTPGKRTGRL